MEKKRIWRGKLAVCLIVSMMVQMITGALPAYAWAEPDGSWREHADLQKTISVTESEIRDVLSTQGESPALDSQLIPFEEPKKEEAREMLEDTLEDAVLIRQEDLGDGCSAFVAVRAEGKGENARIHNILLIGLNGNQEYSCEFVLQVVNEGGIVIRRTVVTEYPSYVTLPEWETPSNATSSDATGSDASLREEEIPLANDLISGEEGTEEEYEKATLSNIGIASYRRYSEARAKAEEKKNLATSSDSLATSSDSEEESNFFEEKIMYALEDNELGGMLLDEGETEDEESGLFARISRVFTGRRSEEDLASPSNEENLTGEIEIPLASESNGAEEENGAADVEEIPAVMYALPGSMAVAETSDEIKSRGGNRLYFVNMYDPDFAPSILVGENGELSQRYVYIEAVFSQESENGQAAAEKTVLMSYYSDGVYQVQIPFFDEDAKQDEENPYTKVTFRVVNEEELIFDEPADQLEKEKNGYGTWIGRTYRFLGGGSAEDEAEKTETFEYLSIVRDCLFYSGRSNPELTRTSYWGAHPTMNPETLDSQIIYFDLGGQKNEILQTEADGQVRPQLWLHYGGCDGTSCGQNHQITLKTSTEGIYYYQFPYECGADEDSVLVLRGSGDGDENNPGFPFTYSLKEDRNMLLLDGLVKGGDKWGKYEPKFTSGTRTISFSNTLTNLDTTKDKLAAVLWECTENPEDNHPHESLDETKFLELCGKANIFDGTPNQKDSVYVAMLQPVAKGEEGTGGFTESTWNKVKDAWGIVLPKAMTWKNTHIRFFHYTGSSLYTPETDGQLKKEDQEKLLGELKAQLEASGPQENPDPSLDGEQLTYTTTGIHEISEILTVDNAHDYPCFYAGKGHNKMPMHGYWDSVMAVNALGDESLNIPEGTFQYDSTVYYGTADFYDYYSDYEMTGHNRATYLSLPKEEGTSSAQSAEKNKYPVTKEAEESVLDGKVKFDELPAHGDNKSIFYQQAHTLNTAVGEFFKEKGALNEALYFGADNNRYRVDPVADYNSEYNKWERDWRCGGIMNGRLQDDGTLRVSGKKCPVPYFSESFLRGENSENMALGKAFKQVLFPFKKDKAGYWSFDSSDVNDGVRMKQDSNTGMYFLERGKEHAAQLWHNENPRYLFMPFSDPLIGKNGKLEEYKGYGLYTESTFDNLNYMFGMQLNIPFTLPSDGKVDMQVKKADGSIVTEKQDAVFRFSGDDDVWIYVDGILALDLGGIHDFMMGEINFGERTITYRKAIKKEVCDSYFARKDETGDYYQPVPWEEIKDWDWWTVEKYNWKGQKYTQAGQDETSGRYQWQAPGENDSVDQNPLNNPLNPELANIDFSGPHEITIFYMERAMTVSNLRMSFNFLVNNAFEVENQVDTANIQEMAQEDGSGTMDPRFAEAINHLDSFGFSLMTAATKGEPKAVEDSVGYLKPGGRQEYNHLKEPSSDEVGRFHSDASDVWVARTETDSETGSGKAVFKSWGEIGTTASKDEIERRLVNIYPHQQKTVSWPDMLADGDGRETKAEYMSLEIYNAGKQASDNGSMLYVGLLDEKENRVGGWANTLTYGDTSNRIEAGSWNTLRISKEKLEKTADSKFDWTKIKAVQLCFYDETEGAVRSIDFCGVPDLSQEIAGFSVDDAQISDYNSINQAENTSSLMPAAGAWYNTQGFVYEGPEHTEGGQTGDGQKYTKQPVMTDEKGHFYLGQNGSAVFTDKFRVGSYLALTMDHLNPRIFTTTWTLTERGEDIKPIWLSDHQMSQTVEYSDKNIYPLNHPGRKPEDGRSQKEDATNKIEFKNSSDNPVPTVLYRSYENPDDSVNGFRVGVRFHTVLDTAGIVVKKELEKGITVAPEKVYHFAVVYDDIAYMGLETNLKNPFVVQGFSLKANEARYLDVIAGTHYRIYELDCPLEELEDITSIEALLPHLSDTLVSVKQGRAVEAENGLWQVEVGQVTNHDSVSAYSKNETGNIDLREMGHASGTAYTKDAEGRDGAGVQGFLFTNGGEPEKGTGEVKLIKKNEGGDKLAGASFALYYRQYEGEEYELYSARQYITDNKGEINLDNLPSGQYYFVEVKPPLGYQPDATRHYFTIDLQSENKGTVEVGPVINKKVTEQRGRVILTKLASGSNTALQGAEFELWRWIPKEEATNQKPDYNPWENSSLEEALQNGQWKLYSSGWQTGQDGRLTISDLPYGHYGLKETKAPDGYQIPEGEAETWTLFEINSETAVVSVEMFNESIPAARFRIKKVVTPLSQSGDDYEQDPFVIEVKEVSTDDNGFMTQVVLRHNENSSDIVVSPKADGTRFHIREIVPMEYELEGMELAAGTEEMAVLDEASGELTVYPGADATVIVKNKEKHIPYFHDTAHVTNTTNEDAGWKFQEKATSSLPVTGEQKKEIFLFPEPEQKYGKKEDEEQTD